MARSLQRASPSGQFIGDSFMHDIEQLFWVLTALVVAFSTSWMRPGGVLFVSQFGERFRRWPASRALLHNDNGALLVGNLTPFGISLIGTPWPVVLSPDGVAAGSGADDLGGFIAFADMKTATSDGRTLLVNGRPFVTCQSAAAAARWSSWLTELTALPRRERAGWIERELARSCDPTEARRQFATFREHTAGLRWAARMLFVFCYLAFAVVLLGGVFIPWQQVAAGYAALILFTIFHYHRAATRLRPGYRFFSGNWLLLVVSPVDAFRAADKFVRSSVEGFHPIAVGIGPCGMGPDDPFIRGVKRELLHPLPRGPEVDRRVAETETWFLTTLRKVADAQFGGLAVAPPRREDDAIAYCPRCEAQYIREGKCATCDILLIPLTPTA